MISALENFMQQMLEKLSVKLLNFIHKKNPLKTAKQQAKTKVELNIFGVIFSLFVEVANVVLGSQMFIKFNNE